jgi:hypothetical protein
MPSKPMSDADVIKLDELIDRYGITELVQVLSMLCDQRSEDLTLDERSEELWDTPKVRSDAEESSVRPHPIAWL